MMTQFETDARRHELNYELQARNYEALRQYNEKKSRTNTEINGLRADYQAEKRLIEQSLDNLLKERLDLKRRGLECFAPEMEDNYARERAIHHEQRDLKDGYHANLDRLARLSFAKRMAYEELCMLNKKWYAEQVKALVTEAAA